MSKSRNRCATILALVMLGLALAAARIDAAMAQQPVPALVPQGRFVIAMPDLRYEQPGDTSVRRNSRGAWLLTLDQFGTATAACGGDITCVSLGIDGTPVGISQDLQIIIDLVGAGVVVVSGRTRGTFGIAIAGRSISADFRGNVSGEGVCDAAGCDVRMTLQTLTDGGAALTLDLLGTIAVGEHSADWISLGGVGQIAVGPGIFRLSSGGE